MVRLKSHLGWDIDVTEEGRFHISKDGNMNSYKDLESAMAGIASSVARDRVDLGLKVLTSHNEHPFLVLRKMHGTTTAWLYDTPEGEHYTGRPPNSIFYPSGAAAALVEEYDRKCAELIELRERMYEWKIALPSSYGRLNAEDIERHMADVRAKYEELRAKAESS